MSRDPYLFAKFIAVVASISMLAWITLGVLSLYNSKPPTSIERARQEFINSCQKGKAEDFWHTVYGVPNAGSDDPTKWTCQR